MLISKIVYNIKKLQYLLLAKVRNGKLIIGKDVVFSGKQIIRVSNHGNCTIGDKCTFSNDIYLSVDGGNLQIGENVFFNYNCNVMCMKSIIIGDGCLFGGNITLVDNDHNYKEDNFSSQYIMGEIEIGKNCWIGSNVVIMNGSKIGDNCVIGSGSIVKDNISDNSVLIQKRQNIIKKYEKNRND